MRAPEPITEQAIMNVGEPESLEKVSDGIFDRFKEDSQDIYMVKNTSQNLCVEEEEGSKSERDSSTADTEPTESGIMAEHMKLIQKMLMRLQEGQMESTPESTVDIAWND